MNNMLPDKFVRITGVKVKVVVYDIKPLSQDFSVAPIVLSVLRDLAGKGDILIEFSDELLNETTLTEKRIEEALIKTDADLLVFGSYMATRSSVQPMIHLVCTYGPEESQPSGGLPENVDLNKAILEVDPILQLPRHTLLREIMPVELLDTLSFQNRLAEQIFSIAQLIHALKLYKADKFEETIQVVDQILTRVGLAEEWPGYWVPFSFLHMLGGLAYIRLGNSQAAMYTLSNAIARSTPAKMRIQRFAEQIITSLIEQSQNSAETEKAEAEKPPAEKAAEKPEA